MPAEGPPARANPARGLALIATALILGIFVLRQGFTTTTDSAPVESTSASQSEAEEAPDDSGDSEDDGEAEADAEPPAPEPRSASEVTVRVANTTAVGGAAGVLTTNVEQNGYPTEEPTDAAERDRGTTAIIFREGYEAEALVLAEAISPEGVDVDLQELSDGGPQTPTGEPLVTENVHLLILLGADLAEPGG